MASRHPNCSFGGPVQNHPLLVSIYIFLGSTIVVILENKISLIIQRSNIANKERVCAQFDILGRAIQNHLYFKENYAMYHLFFNVLGYP